MVYYIGICSGRSYNCLNRKFLRILILNNEALLYFNIIYSLYSDDAYIIPIHTLIYCIERKTFLHAVYNDLLLHINIVRVFLLFYIFIIQQCHIIHEYL